MSQNQPGKINNPYKSVTNTRKIKEFNPIHHWFKAKSLEIKDLYNERPLKWKFSNTKEKMCVFTFTLVLKE